MTNWDELKRLAEEASWTGRWYDAGCNTVMCNYVDKDVSDHDEIAHPCPLGITGFIAAANPKTILALIAENERLSEMANRLADEGISIADERDQLRAEVEALMKDSDRMEFVAKNSGIYHFHEREGKWNCMDCSNGLTFVGKKFSSLREAIDAAIERGDHSQ